MPVPEATTVKVAVPPSQTDLELGWPEMTGSALTVTVALPEPAFEQEASATLETV
jgi:hypothetical protein